MCRVFPRNRSISSRVFAKVRSVAVRSAPSPLPCFAPITIIPPVTAPQTSPLHAIPPPKPEAIFNACILVETQIITVSIEHRLRTIIAFQEFRYSYVAFFRIISIILYLRFVSHREAFSPISLPPKEDAPSQRKHHPRSQPSPCLHRL